MKPFVEDLQIPVGTITGNMRRFVPDAPGSALDIAAIKNGEYKRIPNTIFTDELKFVKFRKPNLQHASIDVCVVLQSNTTGSQYYMELDDFQEVICCDSYDGKNHTIAGQFYFVMSEDKKFAIVHAVRLNAAQQHQLEQGIIQETERTAINHMEISTGDHAVEIWNEIKANVAKELIQTRKPIDKNGWTAYNLRQTIGQEILKRIVEKDKSDCLYIITETNVNGAGEHAIEYVRFSKILQADQVKTLEACLKQVKETTTGDYSTAELIEIALDRFEADTGITGTLTFVPFYGNIKF